MTSLHYLHIFNCKIKNFTEEITNLTELIELDIYGNQMTVIPNQISKLTNLTELYLGKNQFSEVPPEIGTTKKNFLSIRIFSEIFNYRRINKLRNYCIST